MKGQTIQRLIGSMRRTIADHMVQSIRTSAHVTMVHAVDMTHIVELREKEGLALINGTDGMLGMLLMALADLEKLCASADVIAGCARSG